jgi:hypothetical protein
MKYNNETSRAIPYRFVSWVYCLRLTFYGRRSARVGSLFRLLGFGGLR